MHEVIAFERDAGCTMANEFLINVAVRRWNSFERRHKKSKTVTLSQRSKDLLKGFLAQFPEHNYVEACLKHIADSFTLILCSGDDKSGEILNNLSPISCSNCGSIEFEPYGIVGRWEGKDSGGDMIGAVCLRCNTAFRANLWGIPRAHEEWIVEHSPLWIHNSQI